MFVIMNIYNSMQQSKSNNNNNGYLLCAKHCSTCSKYFIICKFHRRSEARHYFSFLKKFSRWASWGSEGFGKTCTVTPLAQKSIRLSIQCYLMLILILFQITTISKKNGKFIIYWVSLCLTLFWMLQASVSLNLHDSIRCYDGYIAILQATKPKISKIK